MKTGLVWFKNDLRVYDNEVLCQAIHHCDRLLFFFSVEPYLFEMLDLGFRKAGCNRFKFLEQSVLNLQKNLELLGGHLIIGRNSAVTEIPQLVKQYGITEIYAEEDSAYEELNIKTKVIHLLPDVEFRSYWGKTLYHINDIPFTIPVIPLTSKAYRIPVGKESVPRPTFKTPQHSKGHCDVTSTGFPLPTIYGFSIVEYKNAQPFLDGGEDAAINRLKYYTFDSKLLTGYRWSRNKSIGLDYSSKLSPYLALGCISPRLIFKAVKKYEAKVAKNQSTWWIIFELVWRDYFTFKGMKMGNAIFYLKGFKNKDLEFENNKEHFLRWQNGTTGIPFIDAHMRQLNSTGYMSNRGRVNCASYLVHDLKINWTWGAAYFESTLIDYDVSANWMNWHMQAFEIYYTNPVHQSLKYKSEDYIRKWIPELNHITDSKILAPWLFDAVSGKTNYPQPIAIYKKWSRSINRILVAVNSMD
ncbi:DASH family cryptochrome [Bizionia saleffrena]|uniref:Cryptochrome DASH n=1 Tax=Bizionia saleffrena TaxID=291189 RepID=A0A8H2QIH7_9FLAO|nr:DASH family cryptochrome [Bizionia saleffrena]TYB71523.1 DASH family cryptochrome [Bizionia saleffrena]